MEKMKHKLCNGCGITKPHSDYHKRPERPSGVKPQCKDCLNKKRKLFYGKEKQSGKIREVIWARQNIAITYEEYLDRYNLLGGKCEICNGKFDVLCVDHNHKTGRLRGLLCTRCNLAIDNLDESVATMARAIQYIQLHGGIHD
jgi:hypothetical protein